MSFLPPTPKQDLPNFEKGSHLDTHISYYVDERDGKICTCYSSAIHARGIR